MSSGGESLSKKISALTEASPVSETGLKVPFEFVDFEQVKGTPCPCGSSQRGLMRPDNTIASIHRVEIKETARVHYHKVLTETYYFLDCRGECFMELDGKRHPVKAGMAVMIRPGTRHRAVGSMTILNFVTPPFDAHDEWFDDAN